MSNFTKSIVYSCVVLVAGLIASFTIYDNMNSGQSGAEMASIEPASGEMMSEMEPAAGMPTTGDAAMDAIKGASSMVTEAAADAAAIEATTKTIEEIAESAAETAGNAMEKTKDDAKKATSDTIETLTDASEAANEPASAGAADTKAEYIMDAAKEAEAEAVATEALEKIAQ